MITRKIVVGVLVLVSLLVLYASRYCCSVNVHEGEETEGSTHPLLHSHSTLSSSNLSSPHTDVFGRPCDDSLCTQYLNEEELEKFRHCSEHLEKWAANNGTCQFLNGTSHGKVALASFPGSGNTWVRGLLEKATGLCTGKIRK